MAQIYLEVKGVRKTDSNSTIKLCFDGESLFITREPNQKFVKFSIWDRNVPTLNILDICLDDTGKIRINTLLPRNSRNLRLRSFYFEPVKQDDAQIWIELINPVIYKDIKRGKKFKVIANPFGGTGKARKIFVDQVKPIFDAAGCTYDVIYTERRYHAQEIAQKSDLNGYDALVMISGDGIIHEVINGLLSREDAPYLNIPLGVIPGGTGNALSVCLLGEEKGLSAQHAVLSIIKGHPLKLDVCSITQGEKRYFSFLSQNFGIIADIDIGTEHLRWMGDLRLTYGVIKCTLQDRSYPCEMALKIVDQDFNNIKQGYRDLYNKPVEKEITSAESFNDPNLGPTENRIVDVFGSINDPVPDDWITFTEDISMFYAGKVPWMAKGVLAFPCALPGDGNLDICITRKKKITRIKALEIITKFETGAHVDQQEVEYFKVKAYRISPKASEGIICIDGERVPFEAFQVEVHQKLLTFISLEGKYAPTGI
ncbi:hypothetical protein G9A89_015451 [Geosiphon pyriformis]|nr:hypothetical protein G9A89_015451 [Geosiphon pyriformis]